MRARSSKVLGGPPELTTRAALQAAALPPALAELQFPRRVPFAACFRLQARRSLPEAPPRRRRPLSSVVGDDALMALGTVMPRAPEEFWLRHRDGTKRLATLSYLATDPERIAVIPHGVLTPPPGAAELSPSSAALARVLGASGRSTLSASGSARGPLGQERAVVAPARAGRLRPRLRRRFDQLRPRWDRRRRRRRRGASTAGIGAHGCPRPPNWDDLALPPGSTPTRASDRYMLGITFLRLVGAAHFPVQGPQRSADHVNVDLELPRSWRKVPDLPVLWELCERALSVDDVAGRPSPGEWVAELEHVLDVLSAPALGAAVREAQGDPRPGNSAALNADRGQAKPPVAATAPVPDVTVRPVLRRRPPSTWQLINASGAPPLGAGGAPLGAAAAPGAATWWAGRGAATGAPLTSRQIARRLLTAWGGAHRLAVGWARSPGRRRDGLRRLAGILVLDLAGACVVFFIFAMLVSPWIGL